MHFKLVLIISWIFMISLLIQKTCQQIFIKNETTSVTVTDTLQKTITGKNYDYVNDFQSKSQIELPLNSANLVKLPDDTLLVSATFDDNTNKPILVGIYANLYIFEYANATAYKMTSAALIFDNFFSKWPV